jgi:hypothetical protein
MPVSCRASRGWRGSPVDDQAPRIVAIHGEFSPFPPVWFHATDVLDVTKGRSMTHNE